MSKGRIVEVSKDRMVVGYRGRKLKYQELELVSRSQLRFFDISKLRQFDPSTFRHFETLKQSFCYICHLTQYNGSNTRRTPTKH